MNTDPNTVDQVAASGEPEADKFDVSKLAQQFDTDAAGLLAVPPPAVNAHVSLDVDTGLVRLDFSMATRGISMDAEGARTMAQALRQFANDSDRARGVRRGGASGRRGRW